MKVKPNRLALMVHIVNTENSQSRFIRDAIDIVEKVHNTRPNRPNDAVFYHSLQNFTKTCGRDFGYQATQKMMDLLVNDSQCDWLFVTNGDNLVSPTFFQSTRLIHDNTLADMIAFDFVSHHARMARDQQIRPGQHVEVALRRKFVDLSSVILRRTAVAKCPSAKFYTGCSSTKFNQDWKVFQRLAKQCHAKFKAVPEVLLFHN